MRCYAVIDTNILVSALLTDNNDAATVRVISRVLTGEIIPVFNRIIMKEYEEVLKRSKFGFSAELIDYLLNAISVFGVSVESGPTDLTLPDPKDTPFYEAAIAKKDGQTYLVTGNLRHYPRAPFVVTPREMIEIIESQSS